MALKSLIKNYTIYKKWLLNQTVLQMIKVYVHCFYFGKKRLLHTNTHGTPYTLTVMCFTEQEVASYLHGGKVETEKNNRRSWNAVGILEVKTCSYTFKHCKMGVNGPFLEGAANDSKNTLRWRKETR